MKTELLPLGHLRLLFTENDGLPSFCVIPEGTEPLAEKLDLSYLGPFGHIRTESMVQAAVTGEAGAREFSAGNTLRNGGTACSFRLVERTATENEVVTRLRAENGLIAVQHVCRSAGDTAAEIWTEYECGDRELTLELASAFNLSCITPFMTENDPDRIVLHRLRSGWSAEGRPDSVTATRLLMEDSWSSFGVRGERIGQVGSMPSRSYLPFYAVEDEISGVTWAVQLEAPESWQIEAYHHNGYISLTGGIADYLYGHWRRTLRPGERYVTRRAYVTAVKGGLHEACRAITDYMEAAYAPKKSEEHMPVIYNEYCYTWGSPDMEKLPPLIAYTKGIGIEYFVMDAGWYRREGGDWNSLGDWEVNKRLFPKGVKAFTDAVRSAGMRPGIWFEFENLTDDQDVYRDMNDCLLRLDGYIVKKANRCFLDFRRPETIDLLRGKVIRFLKENGFGYMKVDYNENIGLGCDGAESPGEGLRQHIECVLDFFREIKRALPDLVLEICSSGGMRHEPLFVGMGDMVSFSDAHEGLEGAVVAADLRRVMLPAKMQIWATMKPEYDLCRSYYTMVKAMTGRYCLSGNLPALRADIREAVERSVKFYGTIAGTVRQGYDLIDDTSEFTSLRHLKGRLRILRSSRDGKTLVAYAFAINAPASMTFPLPGDYAVQDTFGLMNAEIAKNELTVTGAGEPFGGIVVLRKKEGEEGR